MHLNEKARVQADCDFAVSVPAIHCRAPGMPWAHFRMTLTVAETAELQSVMAFRMRDKVILVADSHRLYLSIRQEQTKKGSQLKLPAALEGCCDFLKQQGDLLLRLKVSSPWWWVRAGTLQLGCPLKAPLPIMIQGAWVTMVDVFTEANIILLVSVDGPTEILISQEQGFSTFMLLTSPGEGVGVKM